MIQTTGYEPDNFTYNSNGSIVSDSRHTYQYGDNGHLVSVDGGVTARYFYDYEMRRRKVVYTDRTILYFYDLEGKLISEKELSTSYWKDYIYIDLEPIARIDQRQPWAKIGDSYLRADKTGGKVHLDWSLYNGLEAFRVYRSTNDFTFSNPQVIQELNLKTYDDNVLNDGNNYAYRIYKNVPTEGLFFYHTDHLMTPLQMTDENQNIVWQAEYYPFGRIYSQSGDIENNLRFPGQYSETNMNLYYNWHRYYSPKIGRYYYSEFKFLTGYEKTFFEPNNYFYAGNNSIIFIDLNGLKRLTCKEAYEYAKKCNKSKKFSDDFIVCLMWKESSWDTEAKNPRSTAIGLMQITKAAAKDAGYDHSKMTDPCTNINAGTTYIDIRVSRAGGDVEKGADDYYKAGSGNYKIIKRCEDCLRNKTDKCCKEGMECFKGIHK